MLIRERVVYPDCALVEDGRPASAEADPAIAASLKYRLVYIVSGRRVLGYDNERGKGDHRHVGDREEPFAFSSIEDLLAEFRGSRSLAEAEMKKQVFVGGTLKGAAARVADAWRRAERGEAVETQDNVTFVSWSALASHMTEKRYELLRRLHERHRRQHPRFGARPRPRLQACV